MELEYRDVQTQVKHLILSKYLGAWGGIIKNGRRKSNKPCKFIYVDCFSYCGKYASDTPNTYLMPQTDRPVYGSPIIGIKTIDLLVNDANFPASLEGFIILIEKDPSCYKQLKSTLLECGYGQRIIETTDFHNLSSGQIALINDDAINQVNNLINFTNSNNTWAFYFLDPYGASGIPRSIVNKIVRCPKHDVMINLMYEKLERIAGSALKEKITENEQKQLDYWKSAFGSKNWDEYVLQPVKLVDKSNKEEAIRTKAKIKTSKNVVEAKERIVIDGYEKTLKEMDSKIIVKRVDLKYPDKNRTMFYLFLTTHDSTGALTLNEQLYNAKLTEFDLRAIKRIRKSMHTNQLPLLDFSDCIVNKEIIPRPPIDEIAQNIYKHYKNFQCTKREIYILLANEYYFASEIDKAILLLKKDGKLFYTGKTINHETLLKFL